MSTSWTSLNAYGHFWTIAPSLIGRMKRWPLGQERFIEAVFTDSVTGQLCSRGRLFHAPNSRRLYVLVHGLGGRIESPYVRQAAYAFANLGYSVLRVGLRGSDCGQPDIYHAGLSKDLEHILEAPMVKGFDEIYVVGFSLGGHIALTVCSSENATLADGFISVCAPLDLKACQLNLDRARVNVYRRHCLKGLKRTVRAALKHAQSKGIDLPIDAKRIQNIRTIHEWDARIVVPRFGFDSVDHYYETVSVGPKLNQLNAPTLIMSARHDPMVPYASLRPFLVGAKADVICLEEGAHVGFPRQQKTGRIGGRGLYEYIAHWCDVHG